MVGKCPFPSQIVPVQSIINGNADIPVVRQVPSYLEIQIMDINVRPGTLQVT